MLHGNRLGGWPWPPIPLSYTPHGLDDPCFDHASLGHPDPIGTELSCDSSIVSIKLKQAKEQKRKGKIPLTLLSLPILSEHPISLEKELWCFRPSAPSPKAQVALHMLSLLMVWLQTHTFFTLPRRTSASALQSSSSPIFSLLPHSSRGHINRDIILFILIFFHILALSFCNEGAPWVNLNTSIIIFTFSARNRRQTYLWSLYQYSNSHSKAFFQGIGDRFEFLLHWIATWNSFQGHYLLLPLIHTVKVIKCSLA